jgi:hypothetical protein
LVRRSSGGIGALLPYDVADPGAAAFSGETQAAIQVQASVPVNGKKTFAIRAPMTATFADLKIIIAKQERLLPTNALADAPQRMTLRVADVELPCDNTASLFTLGYDFAPLLLWN